MATEIIETTPAEARKATAVELVKKLEGEAAQLQTRKQTTAAAVERLHGEIAQAERAGDTKKLEALRKERSAKAQGHADLDRVFPTIDRELELARAELKAATIATHAQRYNELVTKQCALKEVISEAIATLVETLKVKEGLAQQQYKIQMGDIGWLHPGISPEGVRRAFLQEITKRLEDKDFKQSYFFDMAQIDWSCRPMIENGDLRPSDK
jgi:hypothetical protein